MSEHSPEPWTTVSGTGITRTSIILSWHTGSCPEQHIAKDISPEDAARIVACVNFCRQFSTDFLQSRQIVKLESKADVAPRTFHGTPDGFVPAVLLPLEKIDG